VGWRSSPPGDPFRPNDRKKYSVGENAGFKLDDKGGIRIVIAAEKPEGVPEEKRKSTMCIRLEDQWEECCNRNPNRNGLQNDIGN
jgi:hypothetical protein